MPTFTMINALLLLNLAAAPAKTTCPPGQETNADTAGKCCWPGQAWAKTRNMCVGAPNCPAPLVANGESCNCPSGQTRNDDTQGQCCWPGQAWSASRAKCIGVPTQCPAGLSPHEESCVSAATPAVPEWPAPQQELPPPPLPPPPPTPPPTPAATVETKCPAGQVSEIDMQGHCCWPGQAWSSSRSKCIGAPTCPTGQPVQGETCGPAPVVAPPPPPAKVEPSKCPAEHQPTWISASAAGKRELLNACQAEKDKAAAATTAGPEAPPEKKPVETKPEVAETAPDVQVKTAPSGGGELVKTVEAPLRRTRVSLAPGVLFGELTGGTLAINIRIALFTLKERQPLQGRLCLLIAPSLFGGVQTILAANYINTGVALTLAAGWSQKLGPVEVFPHLGAISALGFRFLYSNWALNLVIKGVLGLTVALPAGEGVKFLVGIQGHIGGPASIGFAYVGVEF